MRLQERDVNPDIYSFVRSFINSESTIMLVTAVVLYLQFQHFKMTLNKVALMLKYIVNN